MRVLFTSVPAPSHVDPLLRFATALAVNHDVAFATGPQLVPRVERAGIRAIAAGLDWTEPEADRTFPELRALGHPEWERWWVRNIFFDRAAHPMAADVGALLDGEPFDVVVRMYVEFGGWAAAVSRGIPQVVLQLGQAWTAEQLPLVSELLGPVLERVDPTAVVDPRSAYGDAMLLMHPESYDAWTPPVPWTRSRPPVPEPIEPTPDRPEVLNGLPDRPTVLVTFGTVYNRTPDVFEHVFEALADLDVVAVATVGSTRDPDELGSVPPNIRVRRFVPYGELLPHCDVVLSHGGFGTTMSALVHGLPVVTVPLGADQPWHAANTTRLGLGEAAAFPESSPVQLASALTTVLADPGYRQRAAAYGDELRSLPSEPQAATRLVELVR